MNGHTHHDSAASYSRDKQAIDYEVLSYLIQLYGSTQGQRLHDQLRSMARQTAGKLAPNSVLRSGPRRCLFVMATVCGRTARRLCRCSRNSRTTTLRGVLTGIHVLPFFPSSSDDGFAVVDYRQVRSDLGTWSDVQDLAQTFDVMADLVINHCSREHVWFTDFITNAAPGKDYFFEMDEVLI